jgi:predicted SprT family Zn-dependent metalloprotease
MVTQEMKRLVAKQAKETFRHLGHADLIDKVTIIWRPRFTARMGDACWAPTMYKYEKMPTPGVIRFSVPLWDRATEDERYQCVVHEVCHIVQYREAELNDTLWLRRRGRRKVQPHGREWKALMRKCGLKPERCHNVNTDGVSRKTEATYCNCSEPHLVTPQKLRKIQRGAKYYCKKCWAFLSLTPLQPGEAVIRGSRRRGMSFEHSVQLARAAQTASPTEVAADTLDGKAVIYRSKTLIVVED